MNMYFSMGRIMSTPNTSRSLPSFLGFVSSARLPSDPAKLTTLVISANISLAGAEIRIYGLDLADGTFGTELSGAELHTGETYEYVGGSGNQIAIQIMQYGYKEYIQYITIDNPNQSLFVILRADSNA